PSASPGRRRRACPPNRNRGRRGLLPPRTSCPAPAPARESSFPVSRTGPSGPGGPAARSRRHGRRITLKSMRARVVRLEQGARENAEEASVIKDAEGTVLLPGERKQYLSAIYDAIAGLEGARVVMAKAVRRVEKSPLSDETADDAA